HVRRHRLPETGGVLDVGEQECHRARWWLCGHEVDSNAGRAVSALVASDGLRGGVAGPCGCGSPDITVREWAIRPLGWFCRVAARGARTRLAPCPSCCRRWRL